MPHKGVLYRVVASDVYNGHVCYQVVDPTGTERPIAHVQHDTIQAELVAMALFRSNDRFTRKDTAQLIWVKERRWSGQRGRMEYRLNDYWDEGRWHTWVSQDELLEYNHVGIWLNDPIPPDRVKRLGAARAALLTQRARTAKDPRP